jgi:hypothetical protein
MIMPRSPAARLHDRRFPCRGRPSVPRAPPVPRAWARSRQRQRAQVDGVVGAARRGRAGIVGVDDQRCPGRASCGCRPRPAARRRAARRAGRGRSCRPPAAAQRVQRVGLARELLARHHEAVGDPRHLRVQNGPAQARVSSASRKPTSKAALWMMTSAPCTISRKALDHGRSSGLSARNCVGQAVHPHASGWLERSGFR